jgi:hypothetical protein
MTEPPPLVYYDGMPLDSGNRADDLRSVTALLDVLRRTIADSASANGSCTWSGREGVLTSPEQCRLLPVRGQG